MKNISKILGRCREAETEKAQEQRRIADHRIKILKCCGASCDDGWWTFRCSNCGATLSIDLAGEIDGIQSRCQTIQEIIRGMLNLGSDILERQYPGAAQTGGKPNEH